jgi:hypothetical protein
MKKIFTIFLILIALQACKSRGNSAAVFLYKNQISKDSSESEIVKKYGKPQEIWLDERGRKVLSYSYARLSYNLSSFFPIPMAKSRFNNYEVILIFDKSGALQDVRKFLDQMLVRPLAVCESSRADCNLRYEVLERR